MCICVCVFFCPIFVIYNFKCYCKVNNFCLNASMHGLSFVSSTFLLLLLPILFFCMMLLYVLYNARSFRMDELTSSRNNKIFSAFELLCVVAETSFVRIEFFLVFFVVRLVKNSTYECCRKLFFL